MIRPFLPLGTRPVPQTNCKTSRQAALPAGHAACAPFAQSRLSGHRRSLVPRSSPSTHGKATMPERNAPVDRRYAQITPTNVPLPKSELDAKTRSNSFAYSAGGAGLCHAAVSARPQGPHAGRQRQARARRRSLSEMVVSQWHIRQARRPRSWSPTSRSTTPRSSLMLNGGPDLKHRFLRHVSIGAGPNMTARSWQDNDQEPTGARLTLAFEGHIPELTGARSRRCSPR